MPYNRVLSHRLAAFFHGLKGFKQKKMFGGISWLLHGHMCVGVFKEWLIIRIGVDAAKEVLLMDYAKPMDITGKPMVGWAMIEPDAVKDDEDLEHYLEMAIEFVETLPAH